MKRVSEKKVVGVILAAGFSSRMNGFKATLNISGKSPVEMLIEETKAAGVERIILVTGYKRELLKPYIRENVEEVYNQDYQKGMNSSIKAALRKLLAEQETTEKLGLKPYAKGSPSGESSKNIGALLLPVDIPLISRDVISQLLNVVEEEESMLKQTLEGIIAEEQILGEGADRKQRLSSFWVPTYKGKKGHPLYIPRRFFEEILNSEGSNGLKDVTITNFLNIKYLEVGDERILLDMDTREDYENILKFNKKVMNRIDGKNEPITRKKVWEGTENTIGDGEKRELIKGRRFFLIRHGTIVQHKEKIFLGQADIPLSEKGAAEIKASLIEMKKFDIEANIIYTSSLLRAKESAEIIVNGDIKLNSNSSKLEISLKHGLKEMALGDWDGKPISEIKEKFPAEYKIRGENLLRYKPRGKSENFYDLRYRVEKTLIEILENDPNKDIVIVSHKGVIKVIESLLLGEDIESKAADSKGPIECGQFKVICK